MELSKKNLLQQYLVKQRELGRKQREYKQLLTGKLYGRESGHCLRKSKLKSSAQFLKLEKDELKTQLYTSTGKMHMQNDAKYLEEIRCHIECQEHLSDDIHQLKVEIDNMQRETVRVVREIYDLNCKIVPDARYQLYVAKARKKMQLLEDQLEVGVRRECSFTADNAKLREILIDNIEIRRYFHESYSKMVRQLSSDRKYIIELIEYVLNIYENSIGIYDKTELRKKEKHKKDVMYADMVNKWRQDDSIFVDQEHFHALKNKERPLADLQPKEYKRRDRMRKKCRAKIDLFTNIIEKMMKYSEAQNGIEEVITKFKEQESIYYSYFNYANEMSYHMTLLSNSVNNLTNNVRYLEKSNERRDLVQVAQIEELEKTLQDRREDNRKLLAQKKDHDSRLKSLLNGISAIFEESLADASPLLELLGDNTEINLVNMRQFLKILEQRITDITAAVYFIDREIVKKSSKHKNLVQNLQQGCEEITALDDIVLAQQCPECAEGEAVNVEDGDGDGGVAIFDDDDEFKKRLYEKIKQPEMQYRLHSISQCRLPRSRTLAARR